MSVEIRPVTESDSEHAMAFLSNYEESAQFLINNLRDFGPRITDDPHSGNFKMILNSGKISGVFFLTRVGNLIAQSTEDYSALILESCKEEFNTIKGFIGDWKTMEPIVAKFRTANPDFNPGYDSKEILYRFGLTDSSILKHDPRVRFLTEADFDQWVKFRIDYETELQLNSRLTSEERRKVFKRVADAQLWWGLFEGDELSSIASLNSKSFKIGQVGGVFTPKQRRKRGFSKATMLHLLKDCRDVHSHAKSILFTAQIDVPAQKLYESIGYEKIGNFALLNLPNRLPRGFR